MPTNVEAYSEETRRLIGANIRQLRERAKSETGVTVDDLANGVGIKRGYWYEVESGIPNVTIDVLDRIAGELSAALGKEITVRDLLTEPKRLTDAKRKERPGARR